MACGRGRRSRKAIYEFLCKTLDDCPSNRVEEEVCERPCKFDPEKYGGPGKGVCAARKPFTSFAGCSVFVAFDFVHAVPSSNLVCLYGHVNCSK